MSNNAVLPFPTTKQQAEAWRSVLPPNLLEIAEGRRVGTPKLCLDVAEERAAGLLSGRPVAWRMRKAGRRPGKNFSMQLIITDHFDSRDCVRCV